MSEIATRYAKVADAFEGRLGVVAAERWTSISPCTDWTARDVAVHVVDTHRRVLSTLGQGEPSPVRPDEDLGSAWREARHGISESLVDPARAQQTVSGMFGEQPFESLVGRLLCTDTLVHTWDLARATGQDERLDEGAVAKAAEFLTPIDEAIRRPGGFAAKIDPPPGADAQTRFLNYCGREV